MRYEDYEAVLSVARLNRYLVACSGQKEKALELYKLNIKLSQEFYILQMNGRELLDHAGQISHKMAIEKSEAEYERFREEQKHVSGEASLKEIEEDIKKLKSKK